MNYKYFKKNNAFTLIEVIVSVTIFSLVIVSIITVYFLIADLSKKIDTSRVMQENIKTLTEIISEDIRKNKIKFCDTTVTTNCHIIDPSSKYQQTNTLYVGANRYSLKQKDTISGDFILSSNDQCGEEKNSCFLVKNLNSIVSNSFVTFEKINFYISNEHSPKVTIVFVMKPSIKKGLTPDIIKNHKITYQTTISERLYKFK